MDVAELIDAELGRIHPCTCDPSYTERHDRVGRPLIDPTCIHHEVVGDGDQIAAVLVRYGHLDPTQRHRFPPDPGQERDDDDTTTAVHRPNA